MGSHRCMRCSVGLEQAAERDWQTMKLMIKTSPCRLRLRRSSSHGSSATGYATTKFAFPTPGVLIQMITGELLVQRREFSINAQPEKQFPSASKGFWDP